MKFRLAVLVSTCIVLMSPLAAWSQTGSESQGSAAQTSAAATPAAAPAVPIRHMNATWQDGLAFESDDHDYRIQMGVFMRFDGRFSNNAAGTNPPNTFLMRTLRATIQGRLARYFTFRLQPDFTGLTGVPVADAWADIRFSDAIHVRFGRDKVPIGYEVLLPDANVLFLERGVTVNLMPLRDTGIQISGDIHGSTLSYAAGIFNGQVDGTSNNVHSLDTDSSKDLVGRISVQPFGRAMAKSMKPFERFSLALGGSSGEQHNAPLPVFKTSVQQPYFSFAKDAIADGLRTRLAPQVSYYFHAFGGYSEYVRSREVVRRNTTASPVSSSAWQIVGSWLLTGETAGDRVHPNHAFAPDHHQWGAFQLTARYGGISVDPAAFTQSLTDGNSSREAQVATAGMNWYLTTNVKMLFDAERSVFDHNPAGPRAAERAVMVRMQVNY